jgi:hypothetical protein
MYVKCKVHLGGHTNKNRKKREEETPQTDRQIYEKKIFIIEGGRECL